MKKTSLFAIFLCLTATANGQTPPKIQAQKLLLIEDKQCLNLIEHPQAKPSNCYDFNYTILRTSVDWLDELIQREAFTWFFSTAELLNTHEFDFSQDLQAFAQARVEQKKAEMQELILQTNTTSADSDGCSLVYVGQWGRILQLRQDCHTHKIGTAEDFSFQIYRAFDLIRHKELQVTDIVLSKDYLILALRNRFLKKFASFGGVKEWNNAIDAKFKRELDKNLTFVFRDEGIAFYFLQDTFGPYSSGLIELVINWENARGIIRPEYLKFLQ